MDRMVQRRLERQYKGMAEDKELTAAELKRMLAALADDAAAVDEPWEVDTKEACRLLGVKSATVKVYRLRGWLPCVMLSQRTPRYRRSDCTPMAVGSRRMGDASRRGLQVVA